MQDKVLCVEPSAEMLAKAAKHPNIRPLLMDAVAFAQLPADQMRYSHALLKVCVVCVEHVGPLVVFTR